jgi:hypothetical protein
MLEELFLWVVLLLLTVILWDTREQIRYLARHTQADELTKQGLGVVGKAGQWVLAAIVVVCAVYVWKSFPSHVPSSL